MFGWLWKYLLGMVIFSVGMVVCVVVQGLFFIDLKYFILGFMIAGISILVIMVIKLRKMFNNEQPNFGERTWRSYK